MIDAARVTTGQKRALAAAVLAAPFAIFAASLLISPPAAGTIAGSVLGRIADPVVIAAIVGGLFLGGSGRKWWFAPLVGLVLGAIGVVMAYGFWNRVAGPAAAQHAAAQFIIWAVGFAGYGYFAGVLVRPNAVASTASGEPLKAKTK
jgi:hypothetical protein